MQKVDNRLVCSDVKKSKIRATKRLTSLRRQDQIVKVFECKIVEKRLNSKQKEELERLFLEGKWFYNHILSMKKNGVQLRDINSTTVKVVKRLDKDQNVLEESLHQLSSQEKQAIIARIVSNEKTIASLVKNGFQKHGQLQFKSELNCIPLKQYGNTYKFKSFNKVRISGISGTILVRTGDQLQIADELANANLIKQPDGYYLKVTAYINKENWKEILDKWKRNRS